MFIDFKKQQIHTTDETGINVVSPIRNSEITEQQIILQGTENHRGWSATIDKANLRSARESLSWVVNRRSSQTLGCLLSGRILDLDNNVFVGSRFP